MRQADRAGDEALLRTESWPRVAPISRCWITCIGTGSAPYFSWMTMSLPPAG